MRPPPALHAPGLHIVWFKRDLRAHDHDPFAEAAAMGPVLPLYIVEPGLWREPEGALAVLGQPLVVHRSGRTVAPSPDQRVTARHQTTGLFYCAQTEPHGRFVFTGPTTSLTPHRLTRRGRVAIYRPSKGRAQWRVVLLDSDDVR